MVYGVAYLPLSLQRSLLVETHHFDDSKVLTPTFRSSLMQKLCTPSSDLHAQCGWATTLLSAQSISAAMLKAVPYNLNAQATDATISLIQGVIYPVVSAASVAAKVTRDAALETCWEAYAAANTSAFGQVGSKPSMAQDGWGSGYPSDARCSSWLKRNMDPVFGWGPECRFSWSTARETLEGKGNMRVDWPIEDGDDGVNISQFFIDGPMQEKESELVGWYGKRVAETVF